MGAAGWGEDPGDIGDGLGAWAIPQERLGAWLTVVTVRLCIDAHRRREREERVWARAAAARPAEGVEEGVCDRAEAAWVAGIVSRLPARQAEALHLRARGLTVAQVGHQLGMTSKAAEVLLGRARSAVKARWAGTLVMAAVMWRCVVRGLRSGNAGPALAASAAASQSMILLVHNAGQGPAPSGPAVPVVARAPAPATAAKGTNTGLPRSPALPALDHGPAARPAGPARGGRSGGGHPAGAGRTGDALRDALREDPIVPVPVLALPRPPKLSVAVPANPLGAVPSGRALTQVSIDRMPAAPMPPSAAQP